MNHLDNFRNYISDSEFCISTHITKTTLLGKQLRFKIDQLS